MKTKEIKKQIDPITLAFKYHDQSIQWLEEVEFSQDEQKVFRKLTKFSFLRLEFAKINGANQKGNSKIKDIEKTGVELLKKVKSHNNHLGELVERNELILEEIVKSEHKKIQREIENYALKFKDVKKKIFGIIKDIMKAHKQKLLINKQ